MSDFFKRKTEKKSRSPAAVPADPAKASISKLFSRFPATEKESSAEIPAKPRFRGFFSRLPLKEQIFFAKRLSILIKAGISLPQGLEMIKKQTRSGGTHKVLDHVIKDVENGHFLAKAMGRFKRTFGEFAVSIVEIGEASGTLPENLNYLAEELKKKQELRRKVISAMFYPAFIVLATFAVTALLMVFVFPKILPIFESVSYNLPLTTKILIVVSNFLLHYGLYLILGLIAALAAFWLLLKNKRFRFWYDHILLSIPVFGTMVQTYNLTNFCRTLGILLKSDVRIVKATQITAHTTSNLAYRKEFTEVAERMSRGEKVSIYLSGKTRLFPVIMTQMITVGEDTGNLSETLIYLADMYENELDELTKNLSSVLEPALMLFMGLLVGFVAVSIITPIYGITQQIKP